jgi:hypothetical protein
MSLLWIDPEELCRQAEQRLEENLSFRSYLKTLDAGEVDRLFREAHAEAASHIDCRECGRCCRAVQPAVTSDEIPALASRLGCSAETFVDEHLTKIPGGWYMKREPCVFLRKNECTIYEDRPGSCRSYPHLIEPGIADRLYQVLDNYAICPIVFHAWEAVKAALSDAFTGPDGPKSS